MTLEGERWDERLLVWNGVVAAVPALAVRPANVRELRAALTFARDRGLVVRVRGAGEGAHDERALTLDLSLLRPL